jgi:hypothetical protein
MDGAPGAFNFLFPDPYSLLSHPCASRSIAQVTTPVIDT